MDDPSAHTENGGCNQGDDSGTEPAYRACDCRHLAVLDIDGTHAAEKDERRQDEKAPGRDRSPDAVQRVADVRGELLRLRARQRHAEVEGVEEAALRDPAPLVDKLGVHDRDLSGRAAEADHPELEPKPKRLTFCWYFGCTLRLGLRDRSLLTHGGENLLVFPPAPPGEWRWEIHPEGRIISGR